jgi:hypothetical protein
MDTFPGSPVEALVVVKARTSVTNVIGDEVVVLSLCMDDTFCARRTGNRLYDPFVVHGMQMLV